MFETVILCEKPSIARVFAPYLARHYDAQTTLVVCLQLAGPLRFRYPRGVPLADFPCISEPEYELPDSVPMFAMSLQDYLGPTHQPHHSTGYLSVPEVKRAVARATRFVFAAAPEPGQVHGGLQFLKHAGISHALALVEPFIVSMLDAATLEATFDARDSNEREHARETLVNLNDQGAVKRYFEWNWNQNALVIFRAPLVRVGLPTHAVISKYELQLLYFLARQPDSSVSREQPTWTDGTIVRAMADWKGTGKYQTRQYLGSPASYASLLEHLKEKGFVVRQPGAAARLSVTARGLAFLGELHPGCQDADLPWRLENWMRAGLKDSRAVIDRYVRTYFGRQKRFRGRPLTP